jgi:putative membrane protein
MNATSPRAALCATAVAAALALAACDRGDRGERPPAPRSDTRGSTTSSDSTAAGGSGTGSANSTAPTTSTAVTGESSTSNGVNSPSGTSGSAAATSGTSGVLNRSANADSPTPGSMISNNPPGATSPSTAALSATDSRFVGHAAEDGLFEVEVARLAAAKASSADVKAFAEMLVADHASANEKLRQIATGHNFALPAALPDARRKEIEQLGKLSGADFDRRFVQTVGIHDHHEDIAAFETASKAAASEDVKNFALSTLPTLKKHLAAAEKLPIAGKGKV